VDKENLGSWAMCIVGIHSRKGELVWLEMRYVQDWLSSQSLELVEWLRR
jgi:hypothetical protein